MSEHKRRKGYWKYYEASSAVEEEHLIDTMVRLTRENPHPGREGSGRGRPPIHSQEKMDFACLYGMAYNHPYREIERRLRRMRDIWDEPAPDHSWVCRHMKTIDEDWMDDILGKTAEMCLAELGDATAPVASDSSRVETSRYEKVERPSTELQDFVEADVKIYLKYHITAILGHQVILSAITTPSNVSDTEMLAAMLEKIRQAGLDPSGAPSMRTGDTILMPTARRYLTWRLTRTSSSGALVRMPSQTAASRAEKKQPSSTIQRSTRGAG